MPYDEFVMWQAFLRRHPRGLAWENWVQARLAQQVDALLPRVKGNKPHKFKDFVWKPPAPLHVLRREAEADAAAKQRDEPK